MRRLLLCFLVILISNLFWGCNSDKYKVANQLISEEKYSDAIAVLRQINGYKDSSTLINKCEDSKEKQEIYNYSLRLIRDGDYSTAIEQLSN